ncbi:hypothetical protein EDD18DRAFT_1359037 [Armillaria luteobubalina]|uniref:Uncharacterized protein n=1 Tax=Armillaria luteobubalina TaxID=153913 RepID=A0AA39URJ0_9AGAR|nr:hypothetical protein EDD18DRAFT_1359037 [Armillaria luteobubalina]
MVLQAVLGGASFWLELLIDCATSENISSRTLDTRLLDLPTPLPCHLILDTGLFRGDVPRSGEQGGEIEIRSDSGVKIDCADSIPDHPSNVDTRVHGNDFLPFLHSPPNLHLRPPQVLPSIF